VEGYGVSYVDGVTVGVMVAVFRGSLMETRERKVGEDDG